MTWKDYLMALGAGALLGGSLLAFMIFVSLDLTYLFLFGLLLSLVAGYGLLRRPGLAARLLLLQLGPSAFTFFLLGDVPGLEWMAVGFVLASLAGYLLRTAGGVAGYLLPVGLLLASVIGGSVLIPRLVEDHLSNDEIAVAPAFSFTGLDGTTYTNERLRDSVVVLDYWGTWCRPCIAEMEVLDKLERDYADRGVVFLMVNTMQGGDDHEKVVAFARRNTFGFTYCLEPGRSSHRALEFTGVPALAVIDRQGRVVFRHEGYNESEDLYGLLARQLDALLPPGR